MGPRDLATSGFGPSGEPWKAPDGKLSLGDHENARNVAARAFARGRGSQSDVDEFGRPVDTTGRDARTGYPDIEGYAESERALREQLESKYAEDGKEEVRGGPGGPVGLSDELLLRIPTELRPGKTGNWFPRDFDKGFVEAYVDGKLDLTPQEFQQVIDRYKKFSLSPYDPMLKSERASSDASKALTEGGLAEEEALASGEAQKAQRLRDIVDELRSTSNQQMRYQQDLQEEIRNKQAELTKTVDELQKKANDFNPYGSSLGQLFAVVGQAIGAYGAALGKTPNYAAQMVDQMINARIKKMGMEMQAGQSKIGAGTNAVQFAMQGLNDQRLADEAVRGAMYKQALIEIDAIGMASGSKAKRAKAEKLKEAMMLQWTAREEKMKFMIESMAQQAAGGRAASRDEKTQEVLDSLYGGVHPITGSPDGERADVLGEGAYVPAHTGRALDQALTSLGQAEGYLDMMETAVNNGWTGIGKPWAGTAGDMFDRAEAGYVDATRKATGSGTHDAGYTDFARSGKLYIGEGTTLWGKDKLIKRIENERKLLRADRERALEIARKRATFVKPVPVYSKDKQALTGLKAVPGYLPMPKPDRAPGNVDFETRK
jgi:hypothetical protein